MEKYPPLCGILCSQSTEALMAVSASQRHSMLSSADDTKWQVKKNRVRLTVVKSFAQNTQHEEPGWDAEELRVMCTQFTQNTL